MWCRSFHFRPLKSVSYFNSSLFFATGFFFSTNSFAQNPPTYQKCVASQAQLPVGGCLKKQDETGPDFSIPSPTDTGANVFVLPAKVCSESTGVVRGTAILNVDSSESLKTTDPRSERLQVGKIVAEHLAARAGAANYADPNAPRLGATAYSGRVANTVAGPGGLPAYEDDQLNQKVVNLPCTDMDSQGSKYNSSEYKDNYWNATKGGRLLARCNFASPQAANTNLAEVNETPSVARILDFLNFSGIASSDTNFLSGPRGSTDFKYMEEANIHPSMLGGRNDILTKNVITITDGLPNIPKYVDVAACLQKPYLPKDKFENIIVNGISKRVCVYRQPQKGIDDANNFLEDNYEGNYRYINIHNILYLGNGYGVKEIDYSGEIFPPDFLIENSARTGNGKVKFHMVKNKQELENAVNKILPYLDTGSLQRLEVEVNGGIKYNAVSSVVNGQEFSVKILGLQEGENNILLKAVYGDSVYTKSFKINVGNAGSSAGVNCTQEPSDKTVDGDSFTEKNPAGDGFKPFLKNSNGVTTADRVYRNNELNDSEKTSTKYDPNIFRDSAEAASAKRGLGNPAKDLRLQGGTGNCGKINSFNKTDNKNNWLFLTLIFGFPAFIFLRKKFKKNLTTDSFLKKNINKFLTFFLILSVFKSNQINAAGLNSENFSPALDMTSSLHWETARSLPRHGLLWSYTGDYVLRPVEFGDGKDYRLKVSDHLQMNHLGLALGAFDWLDFGFSIPFAFFNKPNTQNYISDAGGVSRSFFFLGDSFIRAKIDFFPKKMSDGFDIAAVLKLNISTGDKRVLLSDDTAKFTAELPMHYSFNNLSLEYFLTPGVSWWGDSTRVTSTDNEVLLNKSKSLLLASGLRGFVFGKPYKAGTWEWEAGLRGDFNNFKPTLNDKASPIEWSAGANFWLWKNLTLHGSYGTGIGSGVTAPLSRLVAGVRYLNDLSEAPPAPPKPKPVAPMPLQTETSQQTLTDLLEEAKPVPDTEKFKETDSKLRLLTESNILELGPINFEFNSAELTPAARQTVVKLHEILLQIKPSSVQIDGHTDSVGSYQYNLKLSQRRAASVKSELIRLGQDSTIIKTEGYAFKYPIASNGSEDGRLKNRRIDVSLDGKSFRKATYSREELQQFDQWILEGQNAPRPGKKK
jgi:outer membrane protein OmpA-like peptidoglycan-associated protein